MLTLRVSRTKSQKFWFGLAFSVLIVMVSVAMVFSANSVFSSSPTPPPAYLHVLFPLLYFVAGGLLAVWMVMRWRGSADFKTANLGSVAVLLAFLAAATFAYQVFSSVQVSNILTETFGLNSSEMSNPIVSNVEGLVTHENGAQYVKLLDPIEAEIMASTYVSGPPTLAEAAGMLQKPTGLTQDADNPYHFTWGMEGVTTAAACHDNWTCQFTVIGGEVVTREGSSNEAWNIIHAEYVYLP